MSLLELKISNEEEVKFLKSKLNHILNRIYGVESTIMSILKSAQKIKRNEQLKFGDDMKLSRITRYCIDMLGKINDI